MTPGRFLVTVAFAVLALLGIRHGTRVVEAFAADPSGRHALEAIHGLLKAAVACAFAYFVLRRPAPRRRTRDPIAFVACAVAIACVLPLAEPGAGPDALLVAGEVLAVGSAALLLASALTLGRCFGVLPEARGLVTRGPYGTVRHPVYLGELGVFLGFTIAHPSAGRAVAFAVFCCAQAVRMRLEERALTREFPEYRDYARVTPRLFPRVRPALARGAEQAA